MTTENIDNPDELLADGMRTFALPTFADHRGILHELIRTSWAPEHQFLQWNLVRSESNVFRGMHVHLGYTEYYIVLSGRMIVGWKDVRSSSPTENMTGILDLHCDDHRAVASPTGICHGLYCPEPSVILIGVTAEWSLENEIGCHWQDPELRIDWPFSDPVLSERDQQQPPLQSILEKVAPWRA